MFSVLQQDGYVNQYSVKNVSKEAAALHEQVRIQFLYSKNQQNFPYEL